MPSFDTLSTEVLLRHIFQEAVSTRRLMSLLLRDSFVNAGSGSQARFTTLTGQRLSEPSTPPPSMTTSLSVPWVNRMSLVIEP